MEAQLFRMLEWLPGAGPVAADDMANGAMSSSAASRPDDVPTLGTTPAVTHDVAAGAVDDTLPGSPVLRFNPCFAETNEQQHAAVSPGMCRRLNRFACCCVALHGEWPRPRCPLPDGTVSCIVLAQGSERRRDVMATHPMARQMNYVYPIQPHGALTAAPLKQRPRKRIRRPSALRRACLMQCKL